MASLFQVGKSGKKVWAVDVYGRGRIRLGKNAKQATVCFSMIEKLEVSTNLGVDPDPSVLAWADRISTRLRDRLVSIGLLKSGSATIADLINLSERLNIGKEATQRIRSNGYKSVEHFFGPTRVLNTITESDAREFKVWLSEQGRRNRRGEFTGKPLASATVSKRIKGAKSIFEYAIQSRWLEVNPFRQIKAGSEIAKATDKTFVDQDMTAKIFAEIVTTEDRLIFALARWGGMRTPSEPTHLKWSQIDWDRRSMTEFRCPKVEHIPGKETRTCPIFPELMPYLEEAFNEAALGAVYCCPSLRKSGNPRNGIILRLNKAIKAAGLPKIGKFFNSLRATRATEIDDAFGSKAESEWIGHGADVAMRHYLMVTDEKFARATGRISANSDPDLLKGGSASSEKEVF